MTIENEFAWEKYEKRFLELENRLAKRGPTAAVATFGIVERSMQRGPFSDVRKDDTIMELREEIRSLKAEIDRSRLLIDETLKMKVDIEALVRKKDSELTKQCAVRKILELENNGLKFKINKMSFNEAIKPPSVHYRRSRKTGIIEWLKKPLIVIEPE